MKRVGYLAGAGALVPVVIGIAAPVAAQAAPQAAKSEIGLAKKVSMFGVVPDASCVAGTRFNYTASGNVGGHFFYTNTGSTTCIGTVTVRLKFNKTFSKSGFVDVGWSQAGVSRTGHVKMHGTAGGFASGNVTIRQSFIGPALVCVHSTFQAKGPCQFIG